MVVLHIIQIFEHALTHSPIPPPHTPPDLLVRIPRSISGINVLVYTYIHTYTRTPEIIIHVHNMYTACTLHLYYMWYDNGGNATDSFFE